MIKVLLLLSIAVTLISAKRPSKRTLADNAEQDASEYERSVLHLTVTRAVPDPDAPWSTQNLDVAGHSGIIVGENKVLTQASILSNAVYIQVQKVDDVEKVPMRVVFADYEANLALLSPVDGRTLSGVRVMPVGLDIAIGSDVALLSIENERQLRRADGRAMEVRLREAATSGLVVPMYSIAGLNRPACKSDPVIKKGSLIGICFGVSEGQPLAVTAGVLNHFLKDQLSAETYRGFGNLGLTLHPVRSPWQRKILGVPAGKGALRVSGMSDTSPFGDCVKVDDVLLAVDDIAVDHRGFYLHPRWGMSPIGHYIAGKYAGEALNLRLSRLGKVTNCNRILRRYSNQDRLVPGPSNTASLPHLIFGGLVFQELTVDYLATFGRDWQSKAPNRLLFIYNYLNDSTLTRKRILMLTNVLADEFNTGYEKMTHLILDSVNGRPVNSIDELKIILKLPGQQRSGAEYARFLFKNSFEVVIPYEGLESSHKRIARAYSVSQSSSFFAR